MTYIIFGIELAHTVSQAGPGRQPQLILVTALLPQLNSINVVGEHARNAARIVAGICHPVLDDFLTNKCQFCDAIIEGICSAYQAMQMTQTPHGTVLSEVDAEVSRKSQEVKIPSPSNTSCINHCLM
jgi:hypothetical protein